MVQETVDVIVVGSGQGGGPLAQAFASAGRQTVLIEREHVGGTCVNEGCTPTKTMIASARVAHLARRAGDYGVLTGEITIDMNRVRERKRSIVDQFRGGSESRLRNTDGLEFIDGDARFVDDMTIVVALNDGGERRLTAETIVLNVGERPRHLDIPGASDVDILDSTSVMELAHVPEHLVVIGGGVIGVEFGQLFRRLGAEVTIVHRSGQLLGHEDPDIAAALAEIFQEDGIRLELDASPTSIEYVNGQLRVTIGRREGTSQTIACSHVLAAMGRIPNTDTLDLETTHLSVDDRGYIETNARLETEVPGIFAIGDIRPGPKFTHVSYDDYRIIQANLIDQGDRSIHDRPVPYTVFTDPQLGRVGLSERQAREQGTPYRLATMPMTSVARALETDETRGMIKALVHPETDQILGAAVLGIDGGELMSMIEIAMMGNLPYTALRDGVFSHPSLSEALNNLFWSFQESR